MILCYYYKCDVGYEEKSPPPPNPNPRKWNFHFSTHHEKYPVRNSIHSPGVQLLMEAYI